MKFRFFILLAAAGVLAACAKEETGTSESGKDGKIVAQFGVGLSDVKTTLSPAENAKRKIFWAAGDCIAINGLASEPLTEEAAGGVTAVFDFTEYYTKPCNVLYPASMYKDEATITLPALQVYEADGFKSDAYPMSARSESATGATLSPLCAMIKLPIKLAGGTSPDTDRISNIVFSGNDGEQVSGDFSIDYESGVLKPASSADEDKTVLMNVNKSLGADPLPIVMVVPAGDYDSGFSIRVTDVAGHYMDMSKNTAFTVEAGHLYVMPEFEFVPTGTQLGIEISSAGDLIAFAQNYNSKAITPEGLIATLTQDITFDANSSAAFNATGGIGLKASYGDAEDYYFNGLFNGNGKTISGLQATVPLFKATGGAGYVQDLNLDNSCSFTFTHPNDAEGMFGSIVGYHKGDLIRVSVASDVTLTEKEEITQMTSLGGLVGRGTTGTLNECTYSGLISTPAGFAGTGKFMLGGLVGRFSNDGGVENSYFKGAISNEAQVTPVDPSKPDKSNPYLIIGGIVGHISGGGYVYACATTADHEVVAGAYSGSSGVIVNKTGVAYNSTVGGIVGELNNGSVSACVNDAPILITIIRLTDVDLTARYVKTGGIVGKNDADGLVSGCTNNGNIQHNSNTRLQEAGGIVGWNAGAVEGDQSVNNGDITFATTGVDPIYAARVPYLGGIIGENLSTRVSNVLNNGNLTLQRTEMGNTGFRVALGGVIAYNCAAIDGGESKNIVNTGQVKFDTNINKISTDNGYLLGGIAGYSSASVQNVRNIGYVWFSWTNTARAVQKAYLGGIVGYLTGDATLSGCVNEGGSNKAGEVFFNVKAADLAHTGNYIGGILGYGGQKIVKIDNVDTVLPASVEIEDCNNSGYVHGGNSTNKFGASCFTGGIVAYLTGMSAIRNCENSGVVYNDQRNNDDTNITSTYNGGIAGYVLGLAENPIAIENCNNTVSGMFSRRGWLGGIVGYAEYAELTGCTFSQDVTRTCLCRGIGGIVGWGVNTNVTSCIFSGAELSATQIQPNRAGGILGRLDGGVVDGCYSSVQIMQAEPSTGNVIDIAGGAIVGISSGYGTTVKNCHYKDEINAAPAKVVATGDFTDGGGNVADL